MVRCGCGKEKGSGLMSRWRSVGRALHSLLSTPYCRRDQRGRPRCRCGGRGGSVQLL